MPQPSRKVLIVEDNPRRIELFKQTLESYELIFASSPQEALKRIKEDNCRLVIFNSKLDHKNGLSFIEELNAKTKKQMPLILILGEHEEKIAAKAITQGVSDCLIEAELIPSIIHMTVRRAMEHSKWERIFQKMSHENPASRLKDPITDLYNIFYFKTRLDEEIKRSRRFNFPLTLILFHFEQWDTIIKNYGHSEAHKALKEMGQFLTRSLRSSDMLARINDDYFALQLPHTSTEQAKLVWERLSKELAEYPIILNGTNFYVTLRAVLVPFQTQAAPFHWILDNINHFMRKHGTGLGRVFVLNSLESLPPSG